jgi:hypothetical protein
MFPFDTLNNLCYDSVGELPEFINNCARLTSGTVRLIVGLELQMYLLTQ